MYDTDFVDSVFYKLALSDLTEQKRVKNPEISTVYYGSCVEKWMKINDVEKS